MPLAPPALPPGVERNGTVGVSDGKGGKGLGDQVAEDLMLSRVCFARCVFLPLALAVGFGLVCFTRAIKSSYVCRVNSKGELAKYAPGLSACLATGLATGFAAGAGTGTRATTGLGPSSSSKMENMLAPVKAMVFGFGVRFVTEPWCPVRNVLCLS